MVDVVAAVVREVARAGKVGAKVWEGEVTAAAEAAVMPVAAARGRVTAREAECKSRKPCSPLCTCVAKRAGTRKRTHGRGRVKSATSTEKERRALA